MGLSSPPLTERDVADAPDRPRYSAGQRGRMSERQVAGIEARVAYYALPWWRRLSSRRPPQWGW